MKNASALLAMDVLKALKFTINQCSTVTVFTSVHSVANAEPVGCLKVFMHKVKACDDAVPIQQKLSRLPFSVRNAV